MFNFRANVHESANYYQNALGIEPRISFSFYLLTIFMNQSGVRGGEVVCTYFNYAQAVRGRGVFR